MLEVKVTETFLFTKSVDGLKEQVTSILNALESIEKRKVELGKMLSQLDQEVADINHYIEFNTLSACDGFKAYKLLHETLLHRREVKEEIRLIQIVSMGKCSKKSLKKVTSEIESGRDWTYQPRQMKELFGGKEND